MAGKAVTSPRTPNFISVKWGFGLEMKEELCALVKGKVQGVGFRAATYRYANQLGLTGTVCNLADGRVEICVQGTRENLEKLMMVLQTEVFPESIEKIDLDYHPIKQAYSNFRVIHKGGT